MKGWLIEKLDRIREFGQVVTSGFISDEIAEKRYDICLDCKYFTIKTSGNKLLRERGCSVCGCYMPAKVLFQDGNCPKSLWPEELLSKKIRIGHGISGEGKYKD